MEKKKKSTQKKDDGDGEDGEEEEEGGGGRVLLCGHALRPAALLNLVADALHNFTDGLAIAVACQGSTSLAISTIIAVAVHELPHEV